MLLLKEENNHGGGVFIYQLCAHIMSYIYVLIRKLIASIKSHS